jgi:hypothetical protein
MPLTQDLSKNQLRSQGPGWGPDGSAGGAGAAFAPGDSAPWASGLRPRASGEAWSSRSFFSRSL